MQAHPFSKARFPTPRAEVPVEALEHNGEVKGMHRSIMRVLGRRGVALTPEQIETIHICKDLKTLELWLDRAATESMAAAIFGD